MPTEGQSTAAAPGGFRLGQRPCLDGLRGLAVLAVVLMHLQLIPGGVVGLEILFVLSGFLITVLLIEERGKKGAISLRNFYRRRFLRVLPPLFALLAVGSAVSVLIGYRTLPEMLREAAVAGLFLGNGQTAHGVAMPVFGHTWSLALEVQFYLLWPVALDFLLRANVRRRRILLLLALLLVALVAWRTVLFACRPPAGPVRMLFLSRLYIGLDTHADTLLIGCITGALVAWGLIPASRRWHAGLHRAGWLSLAGLGYLLLRCHHEQHAFYCGLFTLTGLLAAAVIVCLVLAPPRPLRHLLEFPPLVGLGRISYALYLFHVPVCQWLHPRGAGPIAVALGLSAGAAVLSFYLIERPFVRAKQRPQPAAPAATGTAAVPAIRRVA
jgi:peptidoglycan/LPS O-acetylase OafA/YrhL